MPRARRAAAGVFGRENVYFELQKNGLALQDKCNEGIVRIARELAAAWWHWRRALSAAEDYEHHTALLCVQTKSTLAAPKLTFESNQFYLRDCGEMSDAFAEWPEAIRARWRSRALLGRARARQAADPQLRDADGAARGLLRARVGEGLCLRYGDPAPAEALKRVSWSSRSSIAWASTPTF